MATLDSLQAAINDLTKTVEWRMKERTTLIAALDGMVTMLSKWDTSGDGACGFADIPEFWKARAVLRDAQEDSPEVEPIDWKSVAERIIDEFGPFMHSDKCDCDGCEALRMVEGGSR